MLNQSVLELKRPEGAALFDLSAFTSGSEAVLERIAAGQNGIYAWFRSYRFRDQPQTFADDLMAAINAPKFQERTGTVAPYYEVSLRSKTCISPAKEKAIRSALENEEFLTMLKFSLQWGLLFQAPLYVGKSIDLKRRIGSHLKPGSPLRERLSAAGIEIDQCRLLIVPVPEAQPLEVADPDTGHSDFDEPDFSNELLFEEVISRLFNPAFTIRLG